MTKGLRASIARQQEREGWESDMRKPRVSQDGSYCLPIPALSMSDRALLG